MTKKYKLLKSKIIQVNGKTLYKIQALKDFGNIIKKGDLGGYIESESNLSHDGNCWVYCNAKVYGKAEIHGYSNIYDDVDIFKRPSIYKKIINKFLRRN